MRGCRFWLLAEARVRERAPGPRCVERSSLLHPYMYNLGTNICHCAHCEVSRPHPLAPSPQAATLASRGSEAADKEGGERATGARLA